MKIFRFGYCSTFVVIWQLIFNYELIRFKRFISSFTVELCNQLVFLTVFNTIYIYPKIRCDRCCRKLFFANMIRPAPHATTQSQAHSKAAWQTEPQPWTERTPTGVIEGQGAAGRVAISCMVTSVGMEDACGCLSKHRGCLVAEKVWI